MVFWLTKKFDILMINKLTNILKRINGVELSLTGVGFSWDNNPSKEKILFNYLIFLKSKRILEYAHNPIEQNRALLSLNQIKDATVTCIQELELNHNKEISFLSHFLDGIKGLESYIENSPTNKDNRIIQDDTQWILLNDIRNQLLDILFFMINNSSLKKYPVLSDKQGFLNF